MSLLYHVNNKSLLNHALIAELSYFLLGKSQQFRKYVLVVFTEEGSVEVYFTGCFGEFEKRAWHLNFAGDGLFYFDNHVSTQQLRVTADFIEGW